MRAKTMIELLTLSTNLYLIARDKEVMENVTKLVNKGKEKWDQAVEPDEDGEEVDLMQKIISKAKQAKEELDKKMEEIAVKAYTKMHIAHTDDLKALEEKVEILEKQLNLIQVRVGDLDGHIKK